MMRRALGAVALVGAAIYVACGGGEAVRATIGPRGGVLCTADNRVCLEVPRQALEASVDFTIGPSADAPPGLVGEAYEIGPSDTAFLVPAKVTWTYDVSDTTDAADDNPYDLRVVTLAEGQWTPLASPTLDRGAHHVSGTVMHLSPFALVHLSAMLDGGVDGGAFDAGRPDAGQPDAGKPDAGKPDAGKPDAGKPDAGVDAGHDAGFDGGRDAGADAGQDAGVDAGYDAGVDAGHDAGVDAGHDAGVDGGADAGHDAGVDAGTDGGDDAGMDAG